LVTALTVTPALCFLLLSRVKPHREPRYITWLKAGHSRVLTAFGRHPRVVIVGALAVCVAGVLPLRFFGGEFLPEFREGHYVVHMITTPGTSLQESLRIGRAVSQALLANRLVRSVNQQAGRAENGEDTWGTHISELHLDLKPLAAKEAETAEEEIRALLGEFSGVVFTLHSFLAERMEETISGATAEVVVNLFGEDLEKLERSAETVRQLLLDIPGAVDVRTDSQPGTPEVIFRLRQDRLTQFGFQPDAVLEVVQSAYQGTTVAEVYEGNRVFDVVVALDPAQRKDPESIGALPLQSAAGVRLPLRELADIYQSSGRSLITHEGARRRQQVMANVKGRDAASFMAELKRHLQQKPLPSGVSAVFSGSAETQRFAQRELLARSLLAGCGIVVLLLLVFGTWRNLLLLLANLPFALVGGVLAVWLTDRFLTIGSLVGFVTLFGITMRNSIMLLSHYEHLVDEEGQVWGPATAVRGAGERLAPILMTALVAGLGLLPLAVGRGEAGREIEGPMAVVILGGLVTSTILNLLVLPTLAQCFGRFGSRTESIAGEMQAHR
jgi:Cu/Ag efflux pump CusA